MAYVDDADLAGTGIGQGAEMVGYRISSRTVDDKLREMGSPEDFGCLGDGVTDDTVNFNAALAVCKTLILKPGATYLVTETEAPLDDQVVLGHGATVKLANAQTEGRILTLSGDRQKVFGGTWDGNRTMQTGSPFDFSCIRVIGSDAEIANTRCKNSYSIGIELRDGDRINVHHNDIIDAKDYGIYAEKVAADGIGNRLNDNFISNTADAGACGIYLTGQNDPFTYRQRTWQIRGNTCLGPNIAATGVGITARGDDGVCADNVVDGFSIGISADLTSRSAIANNRIFNPSGSISYCLEVNGARNTITGNKTLGGAYSLIMSVTNASIPMDGNTITGNNFESPTAAGISVQATVEGANAQRTNITGNSVFLDSVGTAIKLAGQCLHAKISGNTLVGPGSGVANSRAVFLDHVPSNVTIEGNHIAGWQRAVGCYSSVAADVTDMLFHNNDCRNDVLGTPVFLTAEGSATIGARCSTLWNKQDTTSNNHKHYFDLGSDRFLEYSDSYFTPETSVAGGVGALFVNTNGGSGTTLFVKGSGTGNTGWNGLT